MKDIHVRIHGEEEEEVRLVIPARALTYIVGTYAACGLHLCTYARSMQARSCKIAVTLPRSLSLLHNRPQNEEEVVAY